MDKPDITFDKLPEAVAALTEQVAHIRNLIEKLQPPSEKTSCPIGIDQACKLLMKAKSTVYAMVHKKLIPCYKSGRKLYFYEHELLDWIAGGQKMSIAQTKEEILAQMESTVKRKPTKHPY